MTEAALVIGYGNSLRSDDGAGPRVAELLAQTDDVAVLIRHQLVPELADDLRGRDVVVFVDAAATLPPGAVVSRPLAASQSAEPPGLTHHVSPAALLLLAERLYGARPRAFLVTVGAASFASAKSCRPRSPPPCPRRRPSSAACSLRGGRRVSPTKPPFTDKQGQYLAFIYAYSRISRRPPAEADMQRHFQVTPPSVHQMVLTLERAGLIRRTPGVARSIELLIEPEDLPVLR